MKEQILNLLKQNPRGMRLREIASALKVWNPNLVRPLAELKAEGKISSSLYCDPAQMERYDIWKIK